MEYLDLLHELLVVFHDELRALLEFRLETFDLDVQPEEHGVPLIDNPVGVLFQ